MKLFKKKQNSNSIKAMNPLTPNLKSKNFELTIKSILKEVEVKIGAESDNLKNFKNKEKITSKIIEKYKKQIKEKEKDLNMNKKILATSFKENLDIGNNFNRLTNNKSLDNNINVQDNNQKILLLNNSENNKFFKNEINIKNLESHRDVVKNLNFNNNSSCLKKKGYSKDVIFNQKSLNDVSICK